MSDIVYTVYQTTNKVLNKIYVGMHSTNNPNDTYLGTGGHDFQIDIEKYGRENFEKQILFIFDNPKDMKNKEREIVNLDFISRLDTYNIVTGGRGGFACVYNNVYYDNLMKCSELVQIRKKKLLEKYGTDTSLHTQRARNKTRETSLEKYGTEHPAPSEYTKAKKVEAFMEKYGEYNPMKLPEISQKALQSRVDNGNVLVAERNPMFGWICVVNEETRHNTKIHPDKLEEYISNGYRKGAKHMYDGVLPYKRTPRTKPNNHVEGKIAVTFHETNTMKFIKPEELQYWLDQGWVKGRFK